MTITTDAEKAALMYARKSNDVAYIVKVGSHAYGTNTEDSDVDVRGVWIPPLHRMIDSFTSPKVREHTVGALDVVLQPINKFLRLCAQANPNILDWLFVPDDCKLYMDRKFEAQVVKRRDLFLSKQIYPRFKGYAESHFQKMERGVTPHLGDKRKKDVESHGYSTKNAMHLIRLARMGCEALETGQYNVRRPDAEELLAIRRGEWTLAAVKAEGRKLLARMDHAALTTKLPDRVPMEEVAKMVVGYGPIRGLKRVYVDVTDMDAAQATAKISELRTRIRNGMDIAAAAELLGLKVSIDSVG